LRKGKKNCFMKVLIIRFSSIGDIVLTTPIIRCLKKQLGAEVHFLTKKSFASILLSNPYVDKVFSIEKNTNEVKKELQAEKYDYCIDLHNNLRSLQIKFFLSTKSFTFDKINIRKWLIVNAKLDFLPKNHIVERYLETVKKLNVKNDFEGLDYFIPTRDEVSLPSSDLKIFPQQYIAFVIGAAHATKRLPNEKIIEICKKINFPIVLLGGKDEIEKGEFIANESGKHVYNTCGKFNLNQSASLVEQSYLVISHDTGLMHIAAAFQKKIISIWGNTIPAFGMTPYYEKGLENNFSIEVKNLSCRPCSKIGFEKCPKKHFKCMNEINSDQIIEIIREIQQR
jgi:ADP-heptose:LPS heptosyltransferase